MGDRANFAIRIINQATGPARQISRAVKDVRRSLKSVSTAPLRKVDAALLGVSSRLDMLGHRHGVLKGFRSRLRQAALSAREGTSFFRILGGTLLREIPIAASAATRSIARIGKRVPWKRIGAGLDMLGSKLFGIAKQAVLLGGVLAGLAGGLLTAGVVKAAQFAEQSRLGFTNLTGSAVEGEKAFQRSIALAKTYGLDVQETTKQVLKLRAAQFSIGQAETIVKLTTDLRSLGATAEETKSAVRAITQIKAKGRLQAEELVGQLAEAGIATTLVYEALGKQLGKSQDQVRKLITAGKVSADQGIEAIQAAILKKAHIHEAGEAGKRFAESTLGGFIGRLQAAPGRLFLRIAESARSVTPVMKRIIDDIIREIDSIRPERVGAFVTTVLDAVRAAIPLVKEFAAGFGEGFEAVTAALKVGDATADMRANFRALGKGVAKALELGIKALKLFGKVVDLALTPTGKMVGSALLLAIGFVKVVGAVGAVTKVFGGAAAGSSSVAAGFGAIRTAASWLTSGVVATSIRAIAGALGSLGTGSLALVTGGVGKLVTGLRAVVALLSGPGALIAGAFALGYAIGTWVDRIFRVSDAIVKLISSLDWVNNTIAGIGYALGIQSLIDVGRGNARANEAQHNPGRGIDGRRVQAAPRIDRSRSGVAVGTVHINLGNAGSPADARRMGEEAADGFHNQLNRLTGGALPTGA